MYQQLNLKNKIDKQVEQKWTHREHFDGCQMGEGFRESVENVKGL